MKILILGDSFAANWAVKHNDYLGWPQLLAQDYSVVNLAQAGVSEYKILLQLDQISDLKLFQAVIISHTSPYRVHTKMHPVHANDVLHGAADLILNDCEYHSGRPINWFNRSLTAALWYFKYHFDQDYYKTIYTLLRDRINQRLQDCNVIVVNHFLENLEFASEETVLDFSDLWKTQRGKINHYSRSGNEEIYNTVKLTINSLIRKN